MMTGRGVCGRRHGARRAHRHGRHRPRQEGGAPHQRLAAGSLTRPRLNELAIFLDKLNTWYYSTRCAPSVPSSTSSGGRGPSTRWSRALDDGQRAVRGPALPLLRDVLRATTAAGVCPDNAVIKRGEPGEPLRDRPRLLQGLRHVRVGVPVWGNRDGPGGDLNRILDPQALDPLGREPCGGGGFTPIGPTVRQGRSATTRSSPRPTCRPAGPTSRRAAATASAAATTARSVTTSDPTPAEATSSRRAWKL